MLALALIAAFGLELMTLVAVSLWGVYFGQGFLTRFLLGGGAPLLVAVFWGIFLSPKAAVQLSPLLQSALKLVIFALATAALIATRYVVLGVAFGSLAVTVTFGLYSLRSQLGAFGSPRHPRT